MSFITSFLLAFTVFFFGGRIWIRLGISHEISCWYYGRKHDRTYGKF
jgi:hypothetical protein